MGLDALGRNFAFYFFDQKTQARIMHVHVHTSNPSLSDTKSVGSQEEEQAFHLHQSSQCTNAHTHTGMAIDYCSDILHTFSFVKEENGFLPRLHISNINTP